MRQILKQPNGNLAVWSSLVDDFIITEATPEEYIQFRISEESQRIRKEITEIVDKLDQNIPIAYFDMTWEKALEKIEKVHGKDKITYLRNL